VANDALLAHSLEDGNEDVLASIEIGLEEVTDLTLGALEIALGVTVGEKERAVALVVDINELVLIAVHVGDHHVVRGRAQILHLLASEDINGNKVNLKNVREFNMKLMKKNFF
jgi:hypothetical protein